MSQKATDPNQPIRSPYHGGNGSNGSRPPPRFHNTLTVSASFQEAAFHEAAFQAAAFQEAAAFRAAAFQEAAAFRAAAFQGTSFQAAPPPVMPPQAVPPQAASLRATPPLAVASSSFRPSMAAVSPRGSAWNSSSIPPEQFIRWSNQEDRILLQHVMRHGTRNWGLLQRSRELPLRDNKACCNRFILLKKRFLEQQRLQTATTDTANTTTTTTSAAPATESADPRNDARASAGAKRGSATAASSSAPKRSPSSASLAAAEASAAAAATSAAEADNVATLSDRVQSLQKKEEKQEKEEEEEEKPDLQVRSATSPNQKPDLVPSSHLSASAPPSPAVGPVVPAASEPVLPRSDASEPASPILPRAYSVGGASSVLVSGALHSTWNELGACEEERGGEGTDNGAIECDNKASGVGKEDGTGGGVTSVTKANGEGSDGGVTERNEEDGGSGGVTKTNGESGSGGGVTIGDMFKTLLHANAQHVAAAILDWKDRVCGSDDRHVPNLAAAVKLRNVGPRHTAAAGAAAGAPGSLSRASPLCHPCRHHPSCPHLLIHPPSFTPPTFSLPTLSPLPWPSLPIGPLTLPIACHPWQQTRGPFYPLSRPSSSFRAPPPLLPSLPLTSSHPSSDHTPQSQNLHNRTPYSHGLFSHFPPICSPKPSSPAIGSPAVGSCGPPPISSPSAAAATSACQSAAATSASQSAAATSAPVSTAAAAARDMQEADELCVGEEGGERGARREEQVEGGEKGTADRDVSVGQPQEQGGGEVGKHGHARDGGRGQARGPHEGVMVGVVGEMMGGNHTSPLPPSSLLGVSEDDVISLLVADWAAEDADLAMHAELAPADVAPPLPLPPASHGGVRGMEPQESGRMAQSGMLDSNRPATTTTTSTDPAPPASLSILPATDLTPLPGGQNLTAPHTIAHNAPYEWSAYIRPAPSAAGHVWLPRVHSTGPETATSGCDAATSHHGMMTGYHQHATSHLGRDSRNFRGAGAAGGLGETEEQMTNLVEGTMLWGMTGQLADNMPGQHPDMMPAQLADTAPAQHVNEAYREGAGYGMTMQQQAGEGSEGETERGRDQWPDWVLRHMSS
ncbi:unnamed protein product [Closterium sp. Naga37s-1]|nr:unnamed protein product [Closterium sp. Naga37s-1]